MIVRPNGKYESNSFFPNVNWYENEPDNYVVDETTEEGAALAEKIKSLFPYYTLNIVDGVLVDVTEREKTQEEIDAENVPLPQPEPTAEQLRIEQLEAENAMMALEVANANIRLDQAEQAQADLMLTLVMEGVL